ncbi:hypothetical protein Q7P37_006660 [Cladosporium fusiforme]
MTASEMLDRQPGTAVAIATFCLCIFLACLDAVIIGNALPAIAEDLDAAPGSYAWIGAAYNMAWASLLLTWQRISDIFGRKPVLLVGALVFFTGSVVAAMSRSIAMLIAGRTVQGLGAGAWIVTVTTCITDLFSLRERTLFYAISGATMAFAAAIGPLLGGAFSQIGKGGWRWIFWINLPLTALAAVLMVGFLQLQNPRTPIIAGLRAIDWLGTILVTGAAMMLQLGLQFGGTLYPWLSATVICLLVFSGIGFALFLVFETVVARSPILPVRILRDRSAVAILAVVFVHGFFYISVLYYIPLYFQVVLGASAIQAGVWMLVGALTMPVATVLSGIFMDRTGRFRPIIWVAAVFMVLTPGLFINFPAHRSWPRLILFQFVGAVGLGPMFQAPLLALQATVGPEDTTAASSLVLFVRTIASAVGLVAGQTVLQNSFPQAPGAQSIDLRSLVFGSGKELSALGMEEQDFVRQSIIEAFRDMWTMFAGVAALGLLASCFIKHQELSRNHVEVEAGLGKEGNCETTMRQEGDVGKVVQTPNLQPSYS